MRKVVLPKSPYPGLKVFCKKCRKDNPRCNHEDSKVYRARIHIPGSEHGIRTKMLAAQNYQDAVLEVINFKKQLEQTNFTPIILDKEEGNDYSVVGAILKFNQYLNGDSEYAHQKKDISKGHRDELIRYCRLFADSLKEQQYDIQRLPVIKVSKHEVSRFYIQMQERYNPKTFNKCMSSLKYFFTFLIQIEEIHMKNPFENYETKTVSAPFIETLTKAEFLSILDALDTYTPTKLLSTGEKKNMYFPWLKDTFKLFLFTGGRREEVICLKWKNLHNTVNGTKLFITENLKLNRNNRIKTQKNKIFPVTRDFEEFLIELGMNNNPNPNDYVISIDRTLTTKTIMDQSSKSFTHYAVGAGIKKKLTLKNLRKTYITWMNQALGLETGKLTSQTEGVMKQYYIDPKVVVLAEKAANEVRIFGRE